MQSGNDFHIMTSMRRKCLAFSRVSVALLGLLSSPVLGGCATDLASTPESLQASTSVVFGRAVTVLTGKTTRWYGPAVRFFELANRHTKERFRVELLSDDKLFVLQLPAGEYELTRVQISEGPFMSMADFHSAFQVAADQVIYLGTWRFGVDSPRYRRMVVISAVQEQADQAQAEGQLMARYPDLEGSPITMMLPIPASTQSRLYEVMPYPRYPRYFRRHWW